jgi:hypothetical protein
MKLLATTIALLALIVSWALPQETKAMPDTRLSREDVRVVTPGS